jgi:hypothetical protein
MLNAYCTFRVSPEGMSGSGRLYTNVAESAEKPAGIRSCAPAMSHPLAHEIPVSEFQTHTPLVILLLLVGLLLETISTLFFFVHA